MPKTKNRDSSTPTTAGRISHLEVSFCKYYNTDRNFFQELNLKGEFIMQELVNVMNQTPIEIALGIDKDGMTTARKLYEFLGLAQGQFSRWCKRNITENDFAVENEDYLRLDMNVETPTGGVIQREDYKLTASFAKKLSMQSKTAKGEQARQYFLKVEEKLKETVRHAVPMTIPEQIQLLAMGNVELNQKVDNLDKKIEDLEYSLPILGIEIDQITAAAKKKGVECLGGKNSEAYADRSLRGKVYNDIYRELKRQFGVTTYKAIKRNQCDMAVEIISGYQLPYVLADQVQYRNAQGNLWGGVRA